MTGRKTAPDVVERIFILKTRDQLPHSVIAERVGVSIWTVDTYVTEFRKAGRLDGTQRSTQTRQP